EARTTLPSANVWRLGCGATSWTFDRVELNETIMDLCRGTSAEYIRGMASSPGFIRNSARHQAGDRMKLTVQGRKDRPAESHRRDNARAGPSRRDIPCGSAFLARPELTVPSTPAKTSEMPSTRAYLWEFRSEPGAKETWKSNATATLKILVSDLAPR